MSSISGSTVYLDLHYLPCLEYFICLKQAERAILEKKENFQKQSYRNRCYILTPSGPFSLTVPVIGGNRRTPIEEIEIDFKQKWVKDHWRAITSAYGKTPFFEHYAHVFESVYQNVPARLWDFNWQLLTICLDLLQWETTLCTSDVYEENPDGNNIVDLRAAIHPKKSYLNNGIYKPCEYIQAFGSEFAGNLSILDLIFNEGPGAGAILNASWAGGPSLNN